MIKSFSFILLVVRWVLFVLLRVCTCPPRVVWSQGSRLEFLQHSWNPSSSSTNSTSTRAFPLTHTFIRLSFQVHIAPQQFPSSESSVAKPPRTHTLHPPTSPAATHRKPHLKEERSLSSDAPTSPHLYATVSHVLVHGVRCCVFFAALSGVGILPQEPPSFLGGAKLTALNTVFLQP